MSTTRMIQVGKATYLVDYEIKEQKMMNAQIFPVIAGYKQAPIPANTSEYWEVFQDLKAIIN